MYILVPTEVHDIFTLHEILNWVAFKGLPIGHDFNFEDDIFGDARTQYPEELYSESYEALGGRLPRYPDYPEYPSPEVLKHIPDLPDSFKQRAIEVHAEHQKEIAKWQAAYDEIAEVAKAEIFLALKQGRLKLRGVLTRKLTPDAPLDAWKSEEGEMWEGDVPPIPDYLYPSPRESREMAMRSGNIDEYECHSMATDWKMALHMRHRFEARLTEISPSFWRQEGIEWEACQARMPEGWFEEIVGMASNILECFPLPPKINVNVSGCAGYLFEPDNQHKHKISQKKGRPPLLDWHAFDVEVARVISQEGLPNKQEAFISEMQEWCLGQWGTRPQRSTVLQRVSPFYQATKSPAKVRK